MTETTAAMVEKLARAAETEMDRQYKAHREWEEAKDVVECLDVSAMTSAALTTLAAEMGGADNIAAAAAILHRHGTTTQDERVAAVLLALAEVADGR